MAHVEPHTATDPAWLRPDLALVALGISISLDELAIGFTIGLADLPVTAVIVAIALQAFLAAQLGLTPGARIGERWRERAEQVAGIALILLGTYLITGQLTQSAWRS